MMSTNAPQEADESGDGGDENGGSSDPALNPSAMGNIYNKQRAHYNRAVSALRKQYFTELENERRIEARRKKSAEAKHKRETLERRRLKAMRTAANAQRQIEKREDRMREWGEELAITQKERDAKKEIYQQARQRIVDELEAECHLWLTTPEEVEDALGSLSAPQKLWTRAGGMVGAPSGQDTGFGDFGDFWRYESHTWDSRPTYKSPQELMLEEIEYMAYLQANNNPKYWTKDRVMKEEHKEQRARLRSIIREEGRRSLLNKQREMMRDIYGKDPRQKGQKDGDNKGGRLPPSVMPAPKLDYLADYEAQEREGVEILKRNPRKFFIFENDLPNAQNARELRSEDEEESSSNLGSLGRPVGLKNPFFGDKPTAFPVRMGRDLPPDTRTEKEKKRDERQERMRVAAEEAALAAKTGTSYEVAMAAEEDLEDGSEDVDYDKAEEEAENELWVDQQDEWKPLDKKVFDMTAPAHRVTPDEVEWIISELKRKTDAMQERIEFENKIRKKELQKTFGPDGNNKPVDSIEEVDRNLMEVLGYDMGKMEALVRELTPEQADMLDKVDFAGRADITEEIMMDELRVVPGLTEEQIRVMAELEMQLLKDQTLQNLH